MKLKKIKSTKTRDIYDVPTSCHDYLLIRYNDETNNDIAEKWAELIDSPFSRISNSDVEGKDFYWAEGLKRLLEKKGIKVPGPIETALVNPFCYTTDLGASHSGELCSIKQKTEFKDHCHTQYKLNMIPIVYSVSGYLCDQMWTEYKRGKRVFGGTIIPPNDRLLLEGEKLPKPVVVAMDKNSNGRHNNSLTYYERVKIISELTDSIIYPKTALKVSGLETDWTITTDMIELVDGDGMIRKVIFHDPATIVFWPDGSKTVVKAQDRNYDKMVGLAMCISKKYFGNKGNYYNEFKKWIGEGDK